jgi:alanyl-tRNA synthetase
MGVQSTTIDFDVDIPAEDLPVVESLANQAVWQDLPVECWYPSAEDLPAIPYRSKRELPWPVRIVQIPGIDTCACCGVHVAHTGQVGLIKLLSCVRFRGGVRIEMVCGGRAMALLNRVYEQNLAVSRAFSAKMLETSAAAQKMNELLAQQKYRIVGLENQIFQTVADGCEGKGDVVLFQPGLDPQAVRRLADMTAEKCGGTAAVFSGTDETGYAYALVNRESDLRQLCGKMNASLGGRGGGRGGFCQGSVTASQTQIRTFFASRTRESPVDL